MGLMVYTPSLVLAETASETTGSGTEAIKDGKPPLPTPEVVEKFIGEFLKNHTDCTSKKDDKGRTIVYDKDGKVFPIQAILPPPPGMLPPPEVVEKAITEFLAAHKDEGFTSKKDDKGRTIVIDKNGNVVPLHVILPPRGPKPPTTASGTDETGTTASGTQSTDTPAAGTVATDTSSDAQNPDEAIQDTSTDSSDE